jgi:hypothetical protein
MVGQWELATTERSKTCVVTLKGDASPQGLKLELEPSCAAPGTTGVRAEISHWWLRNDPPNADWKKLSAIA